MINVNFFRKKAKNILPLLLIIFFLLGAGAIAAEIYLSRTGYEDELANDQKWQEENAADLELSRAIMQVDQWISQAVDVQETLRQKRFPMNQLSEDLAGFIPDEDVRVSSFQVSEASGQAAIVLENTGMAEALSIVENLQAESYIDSVQFLRAESQEQNPRQFSFEFLIDLDLSALEEVAANDD